MSTHRTDTERLEWMVREAADFCYSSSMEIHWRDEEDGDQKSKFSEVVESPTKIGCRVPSAHLYRWHVFDGPTFRDAIDAAMDGLAAATAAEVAEHGIKDEQ